MKILNCPICGKQPKIDFDHTTYGSGYGAFYTIKCKPFLRKPHLTITEVKAPNNMLNEEAGRTVNVTVNAGQTVTYTRTNAHELIMSLESGRKYFSLGAGLLDPFIYLVSAHLFNGILFKFVSVISAACGSSWARD